MKATGIVRRIDDLGRVVIPFESVLSLPQTTDSFRYAHIRQFFQQSRRRRNRNAQEVYNIVASENGFKSVLREHFPHMIRSFRRSVRRFQDIATGERAVNVLFCISNVLFLDCFADVEIPVVQLVPLAQQEISEEQLQVSYDFENETGIV